MWDFSISGTMGLMARTWRFILFRMAVYFGITAAYVLATGVGAGTGYGLGHIFGADGPMAGAVWGGIGGFVIVGAIVYLMREYILYIVKAGHIAVLVELIEGRPIPEDGSQVAYARRIVTAHFAEANALFVVDQLVKGAIRALSGLVKGIASFIPGLAALGSLASAVINVSLTYVDEVILGLIMRERSDRPFETARDGVVLYAQNWRVMVKNAVWIGLIMWGLTAVVWLFMIAPAAAVLWFMPGQLAGWGFALAIVFAWAVKASLLEPFAVAALMSVYFRTIEGQAPDPGWTEKLDEASKPFRELASRARGAMSGQPA